jgi:hypothetical protein
MSTYTYSNPTPTSYNPPIEITTGGIYTGNWESTNGNPAVKVNTSQAVVILNSNIKSNGIGIRSWTANTNITILNTRFYGTTLSSILRRFVSVEDIKNLVVENCYMENSAGIYIYNKYKGNNTPDETVKIRYNKAYNIDCRTTSGRDNGQFFQCNTFRTDNIYQTVDNISFYEGVPYMDISWNEVINRPGLSDVEDNINIYNSRGATWSPMKITNNFIYGAYYYNWQGDNFTGSGIICDSPGTNRGASAAYVDMEDNIVMMSNNNTFGVASGNHINLRRNIGISKSVIDTEDATRLGVSGVGTELKGYPNGWYVLDSQYNKNSTYNNTVVDNVEGVVGENSISLGYWRNDHSHTNNINATNSWKNVGWVTVTNETLLPNPINRATEDGYRTQWLNKVSTAGLTIGIVETTSGGNTGGGGTPTPTPTPTPTTKISIANGNMSMYDIYKAINGAFPTTQVFSLESLVTSSNINNKVSPFTLWNFEDYTHKGVGNDTNAYTTEYNNPTPTNYSAPITITTGGVYVGNWESNSETTAAVTIATTEPVVILNSNIKANGYGISANGTLGTNIKVFNTRHYGGSLSGRSRRFIADVINPKNLVVENCYMENSAGIYISGRYSGNGTASETIKIRYNKVSNINGRTSSGRAGGQFFRCDDLRTDTIYQTVDGVNYYTGIPYMEIAWNEVVNRPGIADVDYNIHLMSTRGTVDNPIKVTNNYIYGAYYLSWQSDNYTGSGIMVNAPNKTKGTCSAYINLEDNIVLMSNDSTFGVAGSNNINLLRNVGVSKSVIDAEDATRLGVTGTGTELKGYPSSWFVDDWSWNPDYNRFNTYTNTVVDHIEGVVGENNISANYWRNDYTNPNNTYDINEVTVTNLISLPNPINRATEDIYRQQWVDKVANKNMKIGIVINPAI